jgi:hypothetical protein
MPIQDLHVRVINTVACLALAVISELLPAGSYRNPTMPWMESHTDLHPIFSLRAVPYNIWSCWRLRGANPSLDPP